MKKIIRAMLYAATFVIAFLLAAQVISFVQYKADQDTQAMRVGQETTDALKQEIGELLDRVAMAGDELGLQFADREFSDAELKDLLRDVALAYPEIRGVTACYEPYAFADDKELYCPYYNKGSQSYIDVGESYDYTVPSSGTAWYTDVVANGPNWADPYFGAAAQEWYVDYGVPFYYNSGPKKGQVRGIVDFALEIGDFTRLVHTMTVGKAGYGVITSKNGSFITHPVTDYVGTKKVQDLLAQETKAGLRQAYQGLIDGERGSSEFYDAEIDDTSLFFYDELEMAGYGMGMAFFKRDLTGDERLTNRRYIKMCLTLSLLLVLVMTLYFGRDVLDRTEIEIIGALATLLLLMNVTLIGYLQHGYVGALGDNDSPPIVDTVSLSNFIGQQKSRAELLRLDAPTAVPTGIYIERMEFQDSYNVNVGGVIWQKYPLGLDDDVARGFRFPQMSPFAEAAYIERTYRDIITGNEDQAGYELIGWDYRVTLRLDLEYADYPFDKRHLSIRIVPLSQQDNVMFTPDLQSYESTSPTQLSGLSPDISISGNEFTRSYFNFGTETYDTTFGYSDKTAYQSAPILNYNIHIKRLLLNAFVKYLIAIAVAVSLIYILILACTKTEARQGIIESMAAFFFVLIFSHIDLRKDIVTADLIFMEFFYFITYILIVLATLNLMAYTKSQTSLFDFNDNQIFRVCYFPTFLIFVLVVMLTKFY